MRFVSRLVCALVGHRPRGGAGVYDTAAGSFVDVAKTQYATCARCGGVRPAPLSIVDSASDDEDRPEAESAGSPESAAPGEREGGDRDRAVAGERESGDRDHAAPENQ